MNQDSLYEQAAARSLQYGDKTLSCFRLIFHGSSMSDERFLFQRHPHCRFDQLKNPLIRPRQSMARRMAAPTSSRLLCSASRTFGAAACGDAFAKRWSTRTFVMNGRLLRATRSFSPSR